MEFYRYCGFIKESCGPVGHSRHFVANIIMKWWLSDYAVPICYCIKLLDLGSESIWLLRNIQTLTRFNNTTAALLFTKTLKITLVSMQKLLTDSS